MEAIVGPEQAAYWGGSKGVLIVKLSLFIFRSFVGTHVFLVLERFTWFMYWRCTHRVLKASAKDCFRIGIVMKKWALAKLSQVSRDILKLKDLMSYFFQILCCTVLCWKATFNPSIDKRFANFASSISLTALLLGNILSISWTWCNAYFKEEKVI